MSDDAIVHVVDDDAPTRDAMRTLFDSAGIHSRTYASAREFLDCADMDSPGCIILDLRMPEMSGLEMQRALRTRNCTLPVIFLTGHGKVSAAVRAMQDGAVDFLTKPTDDEVLLDTVRKGIRTHLRNRGKQAKNGALRARLDNLTPREYEVLQGVTDGLSNKEIARRLGISHKTVELHRAHMMEKMHAQSIAEVVQMYVAAVRKNDEDADADSDAGQAQPDRS